MIDCFASEAHYLDHLLSLARALPGARVLVSRSSLLDQAQEGAGATEVVLGTPRAPEGQPVVVASARDRSRLSPERPYALLEHGCGQTYRDAPGDPHYPGGAGWGGAALILSPGPHAAERWRAAYPELPVAELGGSPRLDAWAAVDDATRRRRSEPCPSTAPRETAGQSVMPATDATLRESAPVGVSFHWDCRLCPETSSSWREWLRAVQALAAERPVLGHAHPRLWAQLAPVYASLGIEATPDFEELLGRCWVYACDNSSTMYEWAALRRPVISLNSKRYRDDAAHGLRFWDALPGPALEPGAPLGEMVAAVASEAAWLPFAERAAERAYGGFMDGRATERAVDAIKEHLL